MYKPATWTTHHPCLTTGCLAQVEVIYEIGRGLHDFYQVYDDLTCAADHAVPVGIAESWLDGDAKDYLEEIFDHATITWDEGGQG